MGKLKQKIHVTVDLFPMGAFSFFIIQVGAG